MHASPGRPSPVSPQTQTLRAPGSARPIHSITTEHPGQAVSSPRVDTVGVWLPGDRAPPPPGRQYSERPLLPVWLLPRPRRDVCPPHAPPPGCKSQKLPSIRPVGSHVSGLGWAGRVSGDGVSQAVLGLREGDGRGGLGWKDPQRGGAAPALSEVGLPSSRREGLAELRGDALSSWDSHPLDGGPS